ncbi:OLC1v1000689C1 [Oldenlandia corymbosa var. corymbosa]|uniref:OLC1v1000689C1 n=1 Tax=Oldenlandia corymbosa var. corymbosa TaxID=529605 RepID=A0AAV1D3J8_OLDCO|nr:OLC1v1000689C1 [Oldenlandia corymbosa var. corymbosa]
MNSINGNHSAAVAPAAPPPLTAEAAVLLQEGINLLFSRWTALQMAVLNEWGGPHSRVKSQKLAVDIFSLLTQSKEKVYIDDVEDFLYNAMEEEFATEISDGSIEEIAENLMLMHEGCLEGDFSLIQKLKTAEPPKNAVHHIPKASSDSDDDSYEDDGGNGNLDGTSMMAVDVPQSHSSADKAGTMTNESRPQSAEAEDGWTVVSTKRGKGRRH